MSNKVTKSKLESTESLCEKGISVVFLDGEIREVSERNFSRCLVQAAYIRMQEGASTCRELEIDIHTTKLAIKSY